MNAGGNARIAIGILRRAARQAKQAPVDHITPDIIQTVTSEAKSEIKQKTVDHLTAHQRTLYNIITEYREIAPRELYAMYCDRADNPKTERMVRNYSSR